ncbi:MAG: LPS export ABC transporter ATP-binding protein [Candidatus Margulisbacteria bacterium GWF2_35_9]|nr:MAG: LPS export ABC transporter ATP-binding protein [Candidatus Margulisbacteria bacterium GWF2_35_9]
MYIETKNLVKKYKSKTVVNDVSIRVNQGEIIGLLGPNGAGKTTTFYMIIGLINPSGGKVFISDTDVTKFPMYKRARNGIGYLPQETSIFKKLSVEDNIFVLWELLNTYPKHQYEKQIKLLLDEMKITHLRKEKGYVLSGGEKRRVEIMRSLAINPKFILLDEPFAGIDPLAIQDIQDIILHLKKRGIGIIITDHNVRETLKITDRAYILHDGKLLTEGDSKMLIRDPVARKFYLGQNFAI